MLTQRRIRGRTPTGSRHLLAILLAAGIALGTPALVFGHAVVFPRTSTPGAYERYALRVPNEKDVATTRVEIRFPADLRVTAFSDVPGWVLTVVTDSTGRITGAVWTGNLPPQRFVEFPFVAANPDAETQLVWPTFQTYEGGETVEWVGPEGADKPASSTQLAAATASSGASGTTLYVAVGALVLGMVSLGLVLRKQSV